MSAKEPEAGVTEAGRSSTVPEWLSAEMAKLAEIIVELANDIRRMSDAGMDVSLEHPMAVKYHFREALASLEPEGLWTVDLHRHRVELDGINVGDSAEAIKEKAERLVEAILEQSGIPHPHHSRWIMGIGLTFVLDGKKRTLIHRFAYCPGDRRTEW